MSDRQRHVQIHYHIQVQVVDRILWMFDLIWFLWWWLVWWFCMCGERKQIKKDIIYIYA